MRIVKISDLTDKEKEKWQQEVQARRIEREETKKQEIEKANKSFENLVNNSSNNLKTQTTNLPTSASSRRKAYNASESTKAITNNTSKSKINLPVANEFKQQLETGKRIQPTQEYSLPTFSNKVRKNALPVASKVVGNMAIDDVSNIIGNVGYGVGNGLISLQQAFNRNAQKQQERDKQLINDINKRAGLPTVDEMNKKTFGNNKSKPLIDLEKQKQVNNQKIQDNIDTSSNALSKKIAELAPTVGQMLPGMISGGAGALYFAGSAKGNYYDEAIQRGMTEEQADRYSGVMALLEAGGETVGANLTKAVGKNIAKGGLKQAGKMFALDVAENVAEESVIEPLSELTATAVAGKEYANWDDIGKRMLESGIDGGLVGMIMGGASAGIGSSVNIVNKVKNRQNITANELQIAKNDINNKLNDRSVQQRLQEAQDIINNVQNEQVNIQEQQITGRENKIAQNQTSAQLNDILNNKELPMQSYQYEQSDNVKINNLRQDANRYFNNSEKARNYVSMLEKIITDKDIEIRLDANLKTVDGRIANGSYSNGVITINPNSTKAGEFIAIHELTHAIGTKEMLNMVNAYRQSNAEFDNAVKGLLQNYQSTEITEEALADISGQLFGNQEFINSIAQNNPNIFQKIYSEIKYLWHQFRGYKNQNQFVEDLYYKWTKVYNSNKELNTNSNYAIETNDKGYKYVRADRQVISGNNPEVWKEQTKNYIDEKIRNNKDIKVYAQDGTELTITKNTSGKATFRNEVRQADGTIRKLTDEEFASKLRAETHIDELGQVSTHKNGPVADTKNHDFAKDGFTYRNAYFEDIDGQYYKITMSVGKNGDINTIYNVGKMQQAQKNRSNSTNRGFKDPNGNNTASSRISSINSIPSQNKDVNTTTKYSIQESENNSGSFSMDNQGRTLSKEQQEFFKDSKVRDENGNLLTVYHGSNSEFTIFDAKKSGQASKESKVGFWFTETKEGAENFANSLWYGDNNAKSYETYLNIKNPKIYNSINNSIELENIDNKIKELKNIIRKLENKNIAIEINKGELKWANENELADIAKYEGIDLEDAKRYHDTVNEYNQLEKDYDNKRYNDSYEKFRSDIYAVAGKSASDANFGGTGMWLENENEIISKFKQQLIDEGYDGIIIKNTKYDSDTMGKNNNQYVAFYPEQIKIVENTNPTDNPDIRYSQNNQTWQQYLDKNFKPTGTRTSMQDILPTAVKKQSISTEDNVLPVAEYTKQKNQEKENKDTEEKIANILKEQPEKVKEKDRVWAIAKANLIDKGIVFEELSQKAKNRDLQGKWDYTLTATARGQYAIGNARYEYDSKTKTNKQISKSLEDIRQQVGDKTEEFNQYMYHLLNIDRMTLEARFGTENKPVFSNNITAEISKKITDEYEVKYPEFKKWAKDVYDYNNANKQELVKNGVISQELADKLNDIYPHYVPIKRVDTKGNAIKVPLDTNRTGINSPLVKAKGGNKDILPLFETMADRTLQTYRASARNNFGVELKNTLGSVQEIQQSDVENIIEEIGNQESSEELLKDGKNGNLPTFTVFDNGEKVTFEITKDMYDALKPLSDSSLLSKTSKTLNKISNFRRGVLTEYNPLFLITNSVKDVQEVLFNSQHAKKTYGKFPEAYSQIIQKGYWYKEYIQNGGEQNSYFKDGNFESNKKVSVAKKAITIPLEAISNANNVLEMAPRLAEYIASRESGRNIETSMLDASRVTTNFKAGGNITKALNRNGFTFLNASVQGAMQQVRNIKEAHAKGLKGYAVLLTKYAIAGLPALILNNLIWKDDEDYDELQDYVKDNYYCIAKYGDGKFIRIPKGRTISVVQKVLSNINEYFTKDKEINIDNFAKDFWEDMKFTCDNLAPNNPLDNNVLSPIFQVISNKSWYGEDIVPTRLQDKPKTEQYDESTDSLSIWLGEKLNQSPYKINYLLDQYGGGVSDVLLPMMTKQAENNVIEDKFTTDSVMKNKYPGEFYEKLEELTVKGNSDKATDSDIVKSKYASEISKNMSDLYKEKREIQNSDLSDKEKKSKLKIVQEQINNIAKNGLNNIEKLKMNDNTATIGEIQYYKVTDLQEQIPKWKKLSTEEIKKNKNISLKAYTDYKEKVAKETIKQRKAGTIKEEASLKDKDKIQILLSSSYLNEEKMALYENYIKSANDTTYPVVKTAGIDITQYLKYKQQEFSSDKKDDGTLTGKTVSKSKQKKVTEYLNSMKITGNQRLLLYAMQGYTTTSSQKTQLANYVQGLTLNKEDKLKLYDKFSGFTVYKNGRVTW